MKILRLFFLAALACTGMSCAKKAPLHDHPGTSSTTAKRSLYNNGVNMPAGSLPPGTRISYSSAPGPGPYIAITFDDGPVVPNTPRLLDMLAARGIKATFFTVGYNAQRNPNVIRRIISEGHEIANHTWNHPKLSGMSDAGVRNELQRSHDALKNITGVAPTMYRPPYGAITARQKQWIFNEYGYPTILWSVDPEDWRTRNAATTRSRILAQTRPGSIILVHDIHPSSIEAMPGTLDGLLAKGFRFVTVSQLISLSQGHGAGAAPVAAAVQTQSFSPGSF